MEEEISDNIIMAKIEHIAIWVKDLEKMKTFYQYYFNADAGNKYVNIRKKYASYFINFSGESRIELMQRSDIINLPDKSLEYYGWAHIALSLGSKEKVIKLTEKFRKDGYAIIGEPRITGDGYFESVVMDPEGNRIELTI